MVQVEAAADQTHERHQPEPDDDPYNVVALVAGFTELLATAVAAPLTPASALVFAPGAMGASLCFAA